MIDPSYYLPWQRDAALEIYKFFNGRSARRGLMLPYHAAAMVEQADAESSFFKDVWGDHNEAYGLFQLHSDRLAKGCIFLNVPVPVRTGALRADHALSIEQQCQIVWHELQTTESAAFAAILAARDAYQAGAAACKYYERAGAPGQPNKRGQATGLWLKWLEGPH